MESSINLMTFIIPILILVISLVSMVLGLDELIGIPVVASTNAGLTAGYLVYLINDSVMISTNVGVISGVICVGILSYAKSNLTSNDMNSQDVDNTSNSTDKN